MWGMKWNLFYFNWLRPSEVSEAFIFLTVAEVVNLNCTLSKEKWVRIGDEPSITYLVA